MSESPVEPQSKASPADMKAAAPDAEALGAPDAEAPDAEAPGAPDAEAPGAAGQGAAPWLWRRYQAFMFLGAFLAFAMEPMVGRLLLPSCGGGFLVWASTLVFFQGALLIGYMYGHLAGERVGRGHAVALLAALAFLPIGRGLAEVVTGADPARDLLLALSLSVGLPFAVLTSTAILAQRWLTQTSLPQAENPYPLYALSNAGSLVALAAYPVLAEPLAGLATQRWVWSLGYLIYLGLGLSLLPRGARAPAESAASAVAEPKPRAPETKAPETKAPKERAPAEGAGEEPSGLELLGWVAASALPSAFLMAVSQRVSVQLGSLPLVWILPLAVYLVTFMLTFGRTQRLLALRRLWPELIALGALHWVLDTGDYPLISLAIQLGLLLLVGLVAHGSLYETRPPARHLGPFYVAVALGGWIGGAAVAFVAPLLPLLENLEEFPLCLFALPVLLAFLRREALREAWQSERRRLLLRSALPLLLAALALGTHAYRESKRGSLRFRNYYGVYRVADLQPTLEGEPRVLRYLIHGTTTHGIEAKTTQEELGRPVGYYHPDTPLGQAFRDRSSGDVAVIGLGAGGMAGYARADESWVFFEIDPLVEDIARGHFTYLPRLEEARSRDPHAPQVEVVIGDARVRLAEQPDRRFSLIAIDAFSGGAIPTHLLTQEAFELYRRKLAPGGRILLHLSSGAYDLLSVAASTARSLKPPLETLVFRKRAPRGLYEYGASAVLLVEAPEDFRGLRGAEGWLPPAEADLVELEPWSDDYTNVLGALWARQAR